MRPSFDSCPVEVVHEIFRYLDLDAVRNLRLSCRTLAAKSSSSRHIAAFFYSKNIELTEQALHTCAEATQAGGLPCLVRELTLSGPASSNAPRKTLEEREQSRQRNIRLLSRLFNHLAKYGPTGRLASLSLEVAIAPDLIESHQPTNSLRVFTWKPVWTTAVDAFYTTCGALAASQLQIESLNVFNNTGQQRTSLPCDVLSRVDWNSQGLARALLSLRSLSISMSNRVSKFGTVVDGEEVVSDSDISEDPEDDDYNDNDDKGEGEGEEEGEEEEEEEEGEDDEDEDEDDVINTLPPRSPSYQRMEQRMGQRVIAWDKSDFTGLASLFQVLKQLESFEMHYFLLGGNFRGLPDMNWSHENHLQSLVKLDSLPNLTRCKLRGVYARETDLLAFIKRTGVRELSLEVIHLCSGTFKSIFDHCSSAASPMRKVYFDVLYEMNSPHHLVFFYGPGHWSQHGHAWPRSGGESLERASDDIKEPISYDTDMSGRGPWGTPYMMQWIEFLRREYGNTYY